MKYDDILLGCEMAENNSNINKKYGGRSIVLSKLDVSCRWPGKYDEIYPGGEG